jgi:1-deoxy-D-xylulose-5-phosphate reductoisomerase
MKNLLILGSTGSIGVNTLDVVRKFPGKFNVFGLTANKNVELLAAQVEEFNPQVVVITDKVAANKFAKTSNFKGEILLGAQGLIDVTKSGDYDILVASLVGFAGLAPTLEAIKRGKRIALANKETLVVAGEIINRLAKEHASEILPVDSEHSAIFQSLVGESLSHVRKLILTASGGPFFDKPKEQLKHATVKEALAHPNWKMGNKVTIDSATMMNKGLEVIEAHWLFDMPLDKIEVLVHPQSIIHSMVEYVDGSIKAQLSSPDMRVPIQYALSYPERFESDFVTTEFPVLRELTFFEPDFEKFVNLQLAFAAIREGGNAPCILNAANEIAVRAFLEGEITFTQISEIIKSALDKITFEKIDNLETLFECDNQTRMFAKNLIKGK